MGRKKLGVTMKRIYLIGFMGSGKTTIGKAIGLRLNLPVFDTDQEISCSTGKTINDIFEESGEAGFRLLEAECLKKLPNVDSIITTGGGIILREENRKWMRQNGLVIYLEASPADILNRLKGDQTRPLLKEDKEFKVAKILEERMPLYLEAANFTFNTSNKPVEAIVNEVLERLKIE